MVKKYIPQRNEEEEEELDLSDLEMDNTGEDDVEQEVINDADKCEELNKKINEEFIKIFKSKGKNPNWLDTMTLTAGQAIDPELNVDDDIKRELIFYNLTVGNAIEGIKKLREHKEKINRPEDFFAEMYKSDKQMLKVKSKIVTEQVRIKKFEEKKQKLQNIKFAKAVILFCFIF